MNELVKLLEMTFPEWFCQIGRSGHRGFRRTMRLFVNGILLRRLLQFDGDFQAGLAHLIILSKSPEAGRNHLNSPFTVSDAGDLGFAVRSEEHTSELQSR